jgi:hypothetical protein
LLADIEKLPTEPKKADDLKEKKAADNKFSVVNENNPLLSSKPDNQSQRDQQANKNPLANRGPVLFGKPEEKKPITIKLEEPKSVVNKQNSPRTENIEKPEPSVIDNAKKDLDIANEKINKLLELLESTDRERSILSFKSKIN